MPVVAAPRPVPQLQPDPAPDPSRARPTGRPTARPSARPTARPTPRALPRPLAALLVAATALLALLAGPATAHAATPTPPGLTPHQERVVLDLIDDICGDTWCEGDHAFEFLRFRCDAPERTCTLRLRIAPRSEDPLRWRLRSGQVHGFVWFRQMVTTSPTGQQSLDPDFYLAVGDLISRIEAGVPVRPAAGPRPV